MRPLLFIIGFAIPVLLHAEPDADPASADAEALTEQDASSSSISITGLQSISEEEARGFIESHYRLIAKLGPSTARADDAAYFLESALREEGYEQARVVWSLPTPDRIVLAVSEGSFSQLAGLVSEGNEALTDEALFELLTLNSRERLGLKLEDDLPYVIDDVTAGNAHIQEFYALLGYTGAQVTLLPPKVEQTPEGDQVTARLEIVEGKIYRVGSVDLGAPPEPDLDTSFSALEAEYADQVFSPATGREIQSQVRRAAINAGYYDTKVTVSALDPVDAGDFMRVDFTTSADFGRKFRVNAVRFSGNEKVKDRFFERMFEPIEGRPLDPTEANAIVSNMLRSGAFRRVTAQPEVVDNEEGLIDIAVEVEEADRQSLGIFGGFGTYEGGILGFEYRHLNAFGTVRRFDSKIEASQRGLIGSIKYIDPWFLWSDWEANVGLFSETRLHDGYSRVETGLRGELKRRFNDIHALSLFIQGSYVDVYDADIASAFLGDEAYLDSFVGAAYELIDVDDEATPRKGYHFQALNSLASTAIGGDFDYLRSSLRLNYHIPLGSTTLHLGAHGAALIRLDGEDAALPIDLRFFNGGARSVRSFNERDLGPKDPKSGYPIGGEFLTSFNAEYEIPIAGPLSAVIFGDAGNLLYRLDDASLDDMHYAAGVGIRLNSPLGPLRIDYGHNMNQGEGEPSGTIHVGFGAAF